MDGRRDALRMTYLFLLSGLLLLTMFCDLVSANPMAIDHENDMSPIPYSESSVYLRSERVVVHIDYLAHINASYTFHNDGDDNVSISIYLPFRSRPEDIKLSVENESLDFSLSEYRLREQGADQRYLRNLMAKLHDDTIHGILFNLSLGGQEDRTVVVSYNRTYGIYDPGPISFWHSYEGEKWIHYDFQYIIFTGMYWNHTIERAEFEIRIPVGMVDKINYFHDEGMWSEREGEYHVCRSAYGNWTIDQDRWFHDWSVGVYWRQNGTAERMGPFKSIWHDVKQDSYCGGICFFSIILISFFIIMLKKYPNLHSLEKPSSKPSYLTSLVKEELEKSPNQSLAHGYDHLERVRKHALAIAIHVDDSKDIRIDYRALSLAALLHDIEQPYTDKRNHAELSAKKAGNILHSLGYTSRMIEKVQDIIREHSSEDGNPPQTWEGKILFDADKLDGLGKIGVERVFALCSQMGLSEEETIDWYERKIEKALPLMQTDIAREMGKEDLEYTRKFIYDFKDRQGGGEGKGGREVQESMEEKEGMGR